MKRNHQVPISKHQRNLKPQARKAGGAHRPIFVSPSLADTSLVLNEMSDGTPASRHPFDLEERTARFGEAIIRFSKRIPWKPKNDRLINQLVGCGTSIGANYCEANEGVSKKDFHNMNSRCVKESKEKKFFLRMIAGSLPHLAAASREHYREAKELHLIFASIFRKIKGQPLDGGRGASQLKIWG